MPKSSTSLTRRLLLLAAALGLALPAAAGAATSRHAAAAADRIIISGAAGHLGGLTVEDLLARGVPARRLILVSRTPAKLARYARMGASVRYGDFTRPGSLRKAFAGGNRMLLISIGFGPMPRPEAHKNAIDAAVADGVKHIVYTSWVALSRGDRTGLGADHYATEQILRKSAVGWTFLRNSIYMEELLPEAARMAASGRAVVPSSENPVAYVSRADCAAAAAAALSTPGHDYKVYDITGPALIDTREVAAAVSAVTGRPVSIVAAAPGSPAASRGFGGPAVSVVGRGVEELTGRPPMTLKAFFRRHRGEILASNH
jgi:NAD(P)H dehydrogenase (quinone)